LDEIQVMSLKSEFQILTTRVFTRKQNCLITDKHSVKRTTTSSIFRSNSTIFCLMLSGDISYLPFNLYKQNETKQICLFACVGFDTYLIHL